MEQLVTSTVALGEALRRVRKLKGLSQTKAGHPFKLTQRTVSTLEDGLSGVRLDTLFRMLAALDLELVIRDKRKSTKQDENISW